MPLEQPESDQQVTGSTFTGYPTVVAGVYYGSGNVGSLPAYVQSIQTDISGAQYITTSGSLPVVVTTPVQATIAGQVSVNNFPATQNVSGTVGAVINNWP